MGQVKFIVYGIPQGKGRPRFAVTGKGVRAYTPAQTASYENLVRITYTETCRGIRLQGPLAVEIDAFFPVPQSESRKRREAMLAGKICHTKKPDVDNLVKSVLDALNGIAYDDDRQVCRLRIRKMYGTEARAEITIREIGEGDAGSGIDRMDQKKDV